MTSNFLKQSYLVKPWQQDIYWANIKGLGQHTNLKHWQGFYPGATKPYVIFTGTNRLPLEKLKLNKAAVNHLNKEGIRFFLYESYHLTLLNQPHNRGWFTEFTSDTPWENIRADELDSIKDFADQYGLTNVKVCSCDYMLNTVLQKTYPTLQLLDAFMFLGKVRQWFDISAPVPNKTIKKSFFCANNRYTPHRNIVMAFLAHFDGNYNWQFEVTNNYIDQVEWFEKNKMDNKYLEMLLEGNEILNKDHFYIDFKSDKIKIEENFGHYRKLTPLLSETATEFKDFKRLLLESFVTVIGESRYAQPYTSGSEKSWAAYANEIPFVLVGSAHTLKDMHRRGFKTFSDYWDESYDDEFDHTLRMNKICKTLDYIGNLPLTIKQEMYEDMKDILVYNKKQMLELTYFPIPDFVFNV